MTIRLPKLVKIATLIEPIAEKTRKQVERVIMAGVVDSLSQFSPKE